MLRHTGQVTDIDVEAKSLIEHINMLDLRVEVTRTTGDILQ